VARNALGKGLGALIREPASAGGPASGGVPSTAGRPEGAAAPASAGSPGSPATGMPALPGGGPAFAAAVSAALTHSAAMVGGALQIDIDLIEPSPYQPRTRFDEGALEELAHSIGHSGIIQPLLARKIGARYQLIAGERRWRAAQRAGFLRVPVVLREVTDEEALEITLVENIQREDLNAVEQARAFQRLIDEFHMTQEEVAERTGKDRATVGNAVRLLTLHGQFLDWIEEGKLTAGHGRALLAIAEPKLRQEMAAKAVNGRMTVRQLERQATRRARRRDLVEKSAPTLDANQRAALDELQRHIGTRVHLRLPTKTQPGQLVLEFYDQEQLLGLFDLLAR